MKNKPKLLIIDVDGVMTTGQFLYSVKGKEYKIFGPHDTDGLNIIKKHIKILFVSADKKGFKISSKRIKDDLGYDIRYVHHEKRYDFIKKIGFTNVIYIGDGYHDAKILKAVAFGISPKNARIEARKASNYTTPTNSGEGAILDASLKIKNKFFKK
jgi:3-deoxy-D-manno-octulosonate 8-phosphate phosphatase (KDO 8-P phosphatase)